MEMWGVRGENDAEFQLVASMAHAHVAQKIAPDQLAYKMDVDDAGEIVVIDGPVQIINNHGLLYGNRMRPIRAALARSLFAFAAGWSIPPMLTGHPLPLFLIVACILCIVRIGKWERRALYEALEHGTDFVTTVGRLTGNRGKIAALSEMAGSKGAAHGR